MPGIYGGISQNGIMKMKGQEIVRTEQETLSEQSGDHFQLGCVTLKGFENQIAEDEEYIAAYFGEIFGIVDDSNNSIEELHIQNARSFLDAVKVHGIRSIESFDGAFIAAVLRKSDSTLVIYNDRFGLYPLYYMEHEGAFYFAQEAKLLGQIQPLEPDYIGISEFLSFDYCLEDRTMFRNVKYILPGQKIVAKGMDFSVSTYWELPGAEGKPTKSKTEYLNELNHLYRRSVLMRRSAETNVIGLTGGFDSRLILAILDDAKVASYNFGNVGTGDQIGASYLAKEYSTDHHYLSFDDLDFSETAREIVLRSDGQCPFERFYMPIAAREKAKEPGGVEISGMGGDAISGQKSNFTGLVPMMSARMHDSRKRRCGKRIFSNATRGRLKTNNPHVYGPALVDCWSDVCADFSRALFAAEKGKTFGNYTMRLKLRTLERRVTMASMWIVNQFLPIRFPVYDYAVMNFFNTVPQTYRFGQRLYIRLIQNFYPRAAKAPHSETGKPVRESHCVTVDWITVRDFIKGKLGMGKSGYNDSFRFVNDAFRNCADLEELVCIQEPSPHGLFNMTEYGDVRNLISKVKSGDNSSLTLLKSIIHISLMNKLFFHNSIPMYYKEDLTV